MSKLTDNPFDAEVMALADLAKALGHPARLRILEILAQTPGCICGDIVERLPLAQATVSQHLKELKQVGLIRGEIEGPRICYCLDHETLAAAGQAFGRLFDGFTCCGDKGEGHEKCG